MSLDEIKAVLESAGSVSKDSLWEALNAAVDLAERAQAAEATIAAVRRFVEREVASETRPGFSRWSDEKLDALRTVLAFLDKPADASPKEPRVDDAAAKEKP